MHSFQPSRGRIFFEVLCALGIAASLGLASQQTGATALLASSAAAALFGLSHAFGMRRGPGAAVEPQRIDFPSSGPVDRPATVEDEPHPIVELEVEPPAPVVASESVEPAVSKAKKVRQAKAPRKGGGGRGASKEGKVAELLPATTQPEEAEVAIFDEEWDHPRIEPLFEPEPHFRQHRAVFGRKAG